MNHTRTEEPSYSLKTLRALLDGATYGRANAHGSVQILLADRFGCTRARLTFISPDGALYARDDNGALRRNIPLSHVLHAEVV